MADTKISALPSATTPLTGAELVPLVQTGGNVKVSVDNLTAGRAVSALSFAGPLNGTVGATTANTGAFTTLTTSSTVTLNGGTANGVAYLNGSKVLTSGTALTFDGTNLGLGVAPSAWGTAASRRAIEFPGGGNIWGQNFGGSNPSMQLYCNAYESSTGPKYTNSAQASGYGQNAGGHLWSIAGSGTAGDPITFTQAMTLDASGNLLVGGTSSINSTYKIQAGGLFQSISSSLISVTDTATVYRGTPDGTGFEHAKVYSGRDASTFTYGSYLAFYTEGKNSGTTDTSTERARIDSAGVFGFGGKVPNTWTNSASVIQGYAWSISTNGTNSNSVDFTSNAYRSGGTTSFKYEGSSTATNYKQSVGEHQWFNAPSGTANNAISFTQAMTLDASGNLIVGGTSPGAYIDANFWNYEKTSSYTCTSHVTGTASGSIFAYFSYGGGPIGTISQAGTTGVLYNVTSDQRLKENIQDAAPASALIDNLQVRQYDWKSDGSHQRYGFVAQELVTVAPEAVHQPADPEEMMAVDYSKLVPMLVKEIQDLRKRLAAAGI